MIPDRCREHSSAVREDDGRVMQRQGGVEGKIPQEQCAIIGANVRALRQRNGWSQVRLGQLMGWQSASTVCAAEGHRGDRQRGFSAGEVEQLAAIFSVSPEQLTMRCATCGGHPPAGFACLACGAIPGSDHPAASTSAAGMRAPSTVQDGMATAEGTPGSLVPMTKAQVGG